MVISPDGDGDPSWWIRDNRRWTACRCSKLCGSFFCLTNIIGEQRIAALGVGPNPIRQRDLTVERLKKAIQLGTSNAQMQDNAAKLGKKIRAEEGIKNALEVITKIIKEKHKG